jgi:hypothetical protein
MNASLSQQQGVVDMKIRLGFVSNSSSSSFIIALPKKPKSANELLQMLKLDNAEDCIPDYYRSEERPMINDIIEYIYNKITKPATNREIASFIAEASHDTIRDILYQQFQKYYHIQCKYPKFDDIVLKYLKDRDIMNKYEIEELPVKFNIRLLDKKNNKQFIFELSDNDSKVGACAEHGDWFQYTPHIKRNLH